MRRNPVSPVVLAAALSACALESELLNSERIAQRFGNYDIEVLEQNSHIRRSNLYSVENGIRTCRTYAVVQFAGIGQGAIEDEHQRVVAGQSLGTTFKDSGWSIRKDNLYVGSVPLDELRRDIATMMQISGGERLAMHAYRLVLDRDDQVIHYATIVEVHHPDYLDEAELREIYAVDPAALQAADDVAAFVALIQSD